MHAVTRFSLSTTCKHWGSPQPVGCMCLQSRLQDTETRLAQIATRNESSLACLTAHHCFTSLCLPALQTSGLNRPSLRAMLLVDTCTARCTGRSVAIPVTLRVGQATRGQWCVHYGLLAFSRCFRGVHDELAQRDDLTRAVRCASGYSYNHYYTVTQTRSAQLRLSCTGTPC